MLLRDVSSKIWKWFTPSIKDKKLTSNSSANLWNERLMEYYIELILVKSYKKGILSLVAKTA